MGLICPELLIAALATAVGAQDISHTSMTDVCPAGLRSSTFFRNRSCYEFNGIEQNWVNARDDCQVRGGRLVSITDADLQAWLSNTAARLWPTKTRVWIGQYKHAQSGVFLWDDYGAIAVLYFMRYRNWASSYPRNEAFSGDCVLMSRDHAWKWLQTWCSSPLYMYSYICEYRSVATFNVTGTSPTPPVGTSVAGVTLSVATDYPLAVLSSSASNDATPDAGVMANKSESVALPLSVSMAVVVVVVALVAVVVWQRKQRSRPPQGSTATWTRRDGDEGLAVGEPVTGNSAHLTVDSASVTHASDSNGVSRRPESHVYAETSFAAPVVKNQKDGALDDWLADCDTEPTYAEPLMQEPSAAITAEPATPCHQYAYIDTATSLKVQPPVTSAVEAASTNKKPGSVVADSGQPYCQALQLNDSVTQDAYEPLL